MRSPSGGRLGTFGLPHPLRQKVSGVAYHILDRLGIYIFEADTFYPKIMTKSRPRWSNSKGGQRSGAFR